VEGTVREVKRRVRVVASSYRAIDWSVTKWIVVTMVEWSSEVRWELVDLSPQNETKRNQTLLCNSAGLIFYFTFYLLGGVRTHPTHLRPTGMFYNPKFYLLRNKTASGITTVNVCLHGTSTDYSAPLYTLNS